MASEGEIEELGELLIEEGILTREEIAESLQAAGRATAPLARILLHANPVRRRELAAFLAMDVEVPHVDLDAVGLRPDIAPLLPETVARKHECVPVDRLDRILCIAKCNVLNRAAVAEIRKLTGLKVKVLHADEQQVLAALDRLYGAAPAPRADLSLPLMGAPGAAAPRGEAPLKAIPVPRNGEAAAAADGTESRRAAEAWLRFVVDPGPFPAERLRGEPGN